MDSQDTRAWEQLDVHANGVLAVVVLCRQKMHVLSTSSSICRYTHVSVRDHGLVFALITGRGLAHDLAEHDRQDLLARPDRVFAAWVLQQQQLTLLIHVTHTGPSERIVCQCAIVLCCATQDMGKHVSILRWVDNIDH